jgi:hypothetical protein
VKSGARGPAVRETGAVAEAGGVVVDALPQLHAKVRIAEVDKVKPIFLNLLSIRIHCSWQKMNNAYITTGII